ncbi:MAG: very short patch repair endonuclease [Clostridiales bacterium]|jgi:DNA mismatch endonuclease (patch repair protein)|nr:very short patch repair endonuclease [Clostridiales bacterium]
MGYSPTTTDEKRRYTMRRIKSKNTAIEVLLRKALWKEGVRYRIDYKRLPGKPDIAITKHKIAVFCDGEFWHGKDWADKKHKFKHNRDYWVEKIERNIKRDLETDRRLQDLGWTVLHFWGRDIQKNLPACVKDVQDAMFSVPDEPFDGFSDAGEPDGF